MFADIPFCSFHRGNNNESQLEEDSTCIKKPPNTFELFVKEQKEHVRITILGKTLRLFHVSVNKYETSDCVFYSLEHLGFPPFLH